jgi:hypothetical protein
VLFLLSPRYLLSIGNVAFSLILGVVALVLTFVFFPAFTLSLMRAAAGIKEQIVSHTGNPQYEIIARTVLHESSILLMGFTLLARIVVGLLISLAGGLFSSRN